MLDDVPNLSPINALETGKTNWREVFENSGGLDGRPVAILSFIANWLTTGSDVWFLKFTNLMIHLLCGGLVFWLTGRLLRQPVTGIESKAWWIALWVASVWLLTPIQVTATLYVIQRMAQLACLFVLLGLLSYVIGRQNLQNKPGTGIFFILFATVVCWPLATLSKQNGILLPLLAFVIEIYFFPGNSNTKPVDRRIRQILIVLIFLPLIVFTGKILTNLEWLVNGYQTRDFSLYERLLTQPRILFDYIANMLLIPGGSGLGLFHDDFIKSVNLLIPYTTLVSILAWLTLLFVGLINAGTKTGLIFFGFVFFIAGHAIESSIFPLELYFEHRNYLPGVGIFISTGIALFYAMQLVRFKRLMVIIFILIPVGYSIITTYRVNIWQSFDDILLASEKAHPDSRRTQAGLAIINIYRGDLEKTAYHLERADNLDSHMRTSGIAIKYAIAYCFVYADIPESVYQRIEQLKTITDDTYTVGVLNWFTGLVEDGECKNINISRIIDILHKKIDKLDDPGDRNSNWRLYYLMARLFAFQENWALALSYLEKIIKLKPAYQNVKTLAREYRSKLE